MCVISTQHAYGKTSYIHVERDLLESDLNTLIDFFSSLPEESYIMETSKLTLDPAAVQAWIEAAYSLPHNVKLHYNMSQLAMILEDDNDYVIARPNDTFDDPYEGN